MDKILRVITKEGTVRLFLAVTTDTVNEAIRLHKMNATAAAALGRALTGAAMMGTMLKGGKDTVSLQFSGGGPIGRVLAISDANANVRGYVDYPYIDLPLQKSGHLDVGGAVGKNGDLTVIKDLGLKEPYIGKVPLFTGEIAEDLTRYFAQSEQVPSVVALGVLINPDLTAQSAGGFIVQVMPEATEEDIQKLEEMAMTIPSTAHMLEMGMSMEDMAGEILKGFAYEILGESPVQYRCNCSRERFTRGLISLGEKEISDMIEEQGEADLVCHFCAKTYHFTKEELLKVQAEAVKKIPKK